MRKFLVRSAIIILVLVSFVVVRTLMHVPQSIESVPKVAIELDESLISRHMASAIQFRTVSNQSRDARANSEFEGFIDWVKETYPAVMSNLHLQQIDHSLLFKWQGTDDSLAPILVTAHYDVVPVIPGTEEKWSHPPFGGEIVDGVIWGRGALDDKSGVIGILEAVTYLLIEGHQPARTVYLSFGHDEEVGGREGAGAIVAYLKSQNVRLNWSLDEGSFLFSGMFPGMDELIASINVAEKGSVTLDIVAEAAGGHSSMPPGQTAVGKLARAITKLEKNPIPGGLVGLGKEMFDTISRHMDFVPRVFFANLWLFDGVIENQLGNVVFANAMIRTTTAPTMLSGSIKTNVLPIEAVATVNFRIHPRDNVDSIIEHVEKTVAADSISVRSRGGRNASVVSDWQSDGFRLIAKSLREVYGDVVITPGLMIAASDSRHYGQIADNAFRFNPFIVNPTDMTGFHGTNEKISVENLMQGVRGYIQIIRHGSEN